jgi:L-amino acid N-acyltransferase YncA
MRKFRSVSTGQCYEAKVNGGSFSEIRRAEAADATRVAAIFNQGVEEGVATFETHPVTPEEAARWIADDLVIVVDTSRGVAGWAKAGPYTDRHEHYAGVREATLYVAGESRRAGAGSALLRALAEAARADGAHKLVGKVFTSNTASIALLKGLGWREVGIHLRHGTLDGEWKDVLVVEKLLDQPE